MDDANASSLQTRSSRQSYPLNASSFIHQQYPESVAAPDTRPLRFASTFDLSMENKKIRFKVHDVISRPYIQSILAKLWRLLLQLQYKKEEIELPDISRLELGLRIYTRSMEIFVTGLGFFFKSSYYVARMQNYRKDFVTFDRFCFDLFSLLGDNILSIPSDEYDLFMRKLFQTVTFTHHGELRFLRKDQIESPWKGDVLEKETHSAAVRPPSLKVDLSGSSLPEED